MADWAADAYEQRLVDRFRQGDPDALATLYDMHVDRVYAYARHIVGNREDAEEVTSEAFLRAFRKAADFRGESPFRGWLFGITRNLCRDHLRQPALLSLDSVLPPADPSADSERLAIRADVRNVLAELPEEYQDVLILCDVEQWDASEAAQFMERSVAATKSLLYRARRALRERLAARWQEN